MSITQRRWGLVVLILLAIPVFLLVFSRLNPGATVRGYFALEQWTVEHWPVESQKWEVEKFAPYLCKTGILRPVRVQVTPQMNLLLDPRDLVSVSILRGGAWQPEIWNSLSPSLAQGSVMMDVGAHIGYFTLLGAAAVGKTGKVIAFEPNPETLRILRDDISASHAGNVTVEPVACTDREQTLTLYAGPVSNTGMTSLASENVPLEGPPRLYQVPGRRIDDVVRELNLARLDAIKVDVEGAEVYVLRGALETLKRFHPKVVVEVVKEQLAAMKSTPEEVTAVMQRAGYQHSKPLNSPPTDWEWTR